MPEIETSSLDDPRKLRKKYMRIFKDVNLYRHFIKLYDKEIEDGSQFPADMAMVSFREIYMRTDMGWQTR
jgi:hypothetical protein